MNRNDRLKICQTCRHRKMDFQRGLLCGLTNEFANFERSCDTFEEDVKAKVEIEKNDKKVGLKIFKTTEPSQTYWHKLGWLLLAIILISFINIHLDRRDFIDHIIGDTDWTETSNLTFYLGHLLLPITFWVFIGWELNVLKNAVIACGIQIVLEAILHHTEPEISYFIHALPFLSGMIYFSFYSFVSQKLRLQFIGIGLIIHFGLLAIHHFVSFMNQDVLSGMLRAVNLRGLSRDIRHVFMYGVELEDSTHYRSIMQFLYTPFIIILKFLLLSFLYRFLKQGKQWKLNVIHLQNKISSGQMALFLFTFYVSIFILSIGVFMSMYNYIDYYTHFESTGFEGQLYFVVRLLSGIVVLLFVSWLYRKILLEYYLGHHRPIASNFFFGQVPLIGIIFWIHNFIAFEMPKKISRQKVVGLVSVPDQGILILITITSALSLLFGIYKSSTADAWLLADVIIGFTIIMLYIYHKNGLYFFIGFELIMFAIIIFMGLYDIDLPEGSVSFFVFLNLSRVFIAYPVFHAKVFEIHVPED